jgi:LemA protein
MRRGLIVILLAGGGLALGTQFYRIRGSLAAERKEVDAAWRGVESALAQRAEVLRDLQPVMEKEAPQESAVMAAFSSAEQRLEQARNRRGKIEANQQLEQTLARVLECAEKYPQLENSQELGTVLDALRASEDGIAEERAKYNEAVELFNARLAVFPDNVVARLVGMVHIDAYFPAPASEQP